jgi:hypothetical protein
MVAFFVFTFFLGLVNKKAAIITWANGLLVLCGVVLFAGVGTDQLTTPFRIGVAAVVALVGTIVLMKLNRKYRNEDPRY